MDSSNNNALSKSAVNAAFTRSRKIETILVAEDALAAVPRLLRQSFNASRAFIIADENTMAAAGSALQKILAKEGMSYAAHIFPGQSHLKSDVDNARLFMPQLEADGGVPVAVGSGVINDLTHYAAFKIGKPFLSVATAASMDGYASAGAPLS